MKFHRFLALFSFQHRTKRITPHHLRKQLDQPNSPLILDVRTAEECKRGHIPGALLIPVDELQQRLIELDPHREQSIVAV